MQTVTKGKKVAIAYMLRYDNAQGEEIEMVSALQPMIVEIGDEDLLEKFEEKIMGMKVGDTFEFILEAKDAYGEYDENGIVNVPRSELMADGEVDEDPIREGNIIPLMDENEDEYEAIVEAVKDGVVTLNFNHPLAGENLYFKGEIVRIED